jgi:Fic family protein
MDWLKENETVNATEIYENYGIRRQTAGKHFKEMSNVGILEKVGKTKYKLPSQVNNGHDILCLLIG